MSDNSKLDALINSKEFKLDSYQRASIDIEGTAVNSIIRVDNSSNFDGSNFTTTNCQLICDINSDVYIDVVESIQIEASGSSEVYLYGEPQITILKFTDTAKLQKKTK